MRLISGSGPFFPIFIGVWQSWQPEVLTKCRPKATSSAGVRAWAAAGSGACTLVTDAGAAEAAPAGAAPAFSRHPPRLETARAQATMLTWLRRFMFIWLSFGWRETELRRAR